MLVGSMTTTNRPHEFSFLSRSLREAGLRHSKRRDALLQCFLATEKHVSAEELYAIVLKSHPGVGLATVHRTLKLFVRCGLAREVRLGDRSVRYEHAYNHPHHDHLVCTACGSVIEFLEPSMEELQAKVARRHAFEIHNHVMQIYGRCARCRGKAVNRSPGS